MAQANGRIPALTIGLDVSDRTSRYCEIDAAGEVVAEGRVVTRAPALQHLFAGREPARVVLEVGSHSPWIARLLDEHGHEVIVANPRRLRLIYQNDRKSDRVDARYLARVGRLDPSLLAPIAHRGPEAQADLALIRSRDVVVRARTQLVNHVRGTVKVFGTRLPECSTESFATKVADALPAELAPALAPVLETIAHLGREIRRYDRQIEAIAAERYPETALLSQVGGVGALTALVYVLTIEDPTRFRCSRAVGAYVGLVPKRSASGEAEPQLPITKAGDAMLRRLLVSAAHYILGPFGPDCDLRRWGLRLAERGGNNAKKRAIVAVARKLAVLLHHLWITGQVYEPLHHAALREPEGELVTP
jgi:transposase